MLTTSVVLPSSFSGALRKGRIEFLILPQKVCLAGNAVCCQTEALKRVFFVHGTVQACVKLGREQIVRNTIRVHDNDVVRLQGVCHFDSHILDFVAVLSSELVWIIESFLSDFRRKDQSEVVTDFSMYRISRISNIQRCDLIGPRQFQSSTRCTSQMFISRLPVRLMNNFCEGSRWIFGS